MKKLLVLSAMLVLGSNIVFAEDDQVNMEYFNKIITGVKVEKVQTSTVQGMFEVFVEGSPYPVYLSKDGKHMMEGNVIDLVVGKNITKDYASNQNKKLIDAIDESEMVIFRAPNEKHVVTIFTTTDCPFCRMLHKEMDSYLSKGITIRYLAFPYRGLSSNGYFDMVSVYCSEDRNKAMNEAVSYAEMGGAAPPPSIEACKNPISEQYALAMKIGVTGTPAIILEDGSVISGYLSPHELFNSLEMNKLQN